MLRQKRGSCSIIDQLKKTSEIAPDNLDFREILGRAYLADKQIEPAIAAFHMVSAVDESRYSNYFRCCAKLY